jgi:hypothetical protein
VHARGERVHEPPEVAALKGSGKLADVLELLLWSRLAIPEEPVEVAVGRATVAVSPADVRDAVAAARDRAAAVRLAVQPPPAGGTAGAG